MARGHSRNRVGKIKVGNEYYQGFSKDYGGKSNPFTAVEVGGTTKYINTANQYSQKPGESLQNYYKRLAKQADQRLVRLEKLSQQEGFKPVTKFAYARAMKDIKSWSGEGATRFNKGMPTSQQALQGKIRDTLTFLRSQTSTKSGIVATYQKRADTINKKYGTAFSWQELAVYWESDIHQKADSSLMDSGTRLQAFYITKIADDPAEIAAYNEQHKVTNTPVEYVAKRLKDLGYDYNSIRGV